MQAWADVRQGGRVGAEARAWFMEEDPGGPFALAVICESLALSSATLRARLPPPRRGLDPAMCGLACLEVLGAGPLTLAVLAARLRIGRAAAVRALYALAREGCVRRETGGRWGLVRAA